MSAAREILAAFAAVGFEASATGGGFNALCARDGAPAVDTEDASIGVSNGDDQVPTKWDDECVVCFYVGGAQVSHLFTTPRAFLATLPKPDGHVCATFHQCTTGDPGCLHCNVCGEPPKGKAL